MIPFWRKIRRLKRRCFRNFRNHRLTVVVGLTILVLLGLFLRYYNPNTRLSRLSHRKPLGQLVPSSRQNNQERIRNYFGDPDEYDGTRVCKIPKLYPFDETSLYLIESQVSRKNLTRPPCLNDGPRFRTDLNSTLIRLDPGSYFWKFVTCCYKPFFTERKYRLTYKDSNSCITLPPTKEEFFIGEEHENIRVKCVARSDPSYLAYQDYFHFFRLNQSIEAKAQELEDSARAAGSDLLSVIFLGIDSVSLTNFQRYLTKTRNYLVKDLEAIEFRGLNKVGRGTMENLMPTVSDCSYIGRRTLFPSNTSDCTLVWTEYAKKGYRTLATEEQFWGIMYERMKRNGRGKREMMYDNLSYISGLQSTITKSLTETFGCFEYQFAPNHVKDRILEVGTKLRGKLYYHHLWTAMTSHSEIGFAKYLDHPFHELLQELTANKLLENTVLILNSDHGTVSSDYSRTAEGLIEARLPLLYFVFPQWFKKKYTTAIENLKRNAGTLSTPHDVYQTLRDIMDLDRITNSALKSRKPVQDGMRTSLFVPVPLNRTCRSAGVPDEYCICWSWTQLDSPERDLDVIRAVSFTLDSMNRALYRFPMCARLDLESILDGRVREEHDGGTFYEVMFQTIPSRGIFGAVLELNPGQSAQFSLVGEVERQNRYFDQNACLSKEDQKLGWLRSACFCV